MTIEPDSTLARAFRMARRGHRTRYTPAGYGHFIPAQQALSIARGMVAASDNAKSVYASISDDPESTPAQVQEARTKAANAGIYGGPAKPWLAPGGHNDGGLYYLARDDGFGAVRGVIAAHEVSGIPVDHKGWYTNPYGESFKDGSGLVWGVVASLPGKDHKPRYLAGYQFGGQDQGITLSLKTIYDSEDDAARAGDSMAEKAGESEKEYQTAWQAGSRWADLKQELSDIRQRVLEVLKENRESGGSRDLPAIHAFIRDKVCEMRGEMARKRDQMRDLANGDFQELIFWPRGESERDAFCEGAGVTSYPES